MDTKKLINELVRDEGFVPHAYQDSLGYWTIGFGRLIDQRLGGGVSEAEARFLLNNDIAGVVTDLDRNVPWWRTLPEGMQRGLANACFNLGWPRLSTFKKMLAALEAGEYVTAALECLDSKWARQVGDRADRIAELFRKGK